MQDKKLQERPPVVAIMGHVDHGKSSLLDYIRKTNVVATEAGGITQRVSAYEVIHTDSNNVKKRITFIDTPGHAAFSGMRQRGAAIADIAILIISAEDSVKPQTLEALNIIQSNKVPFVVAITKIDKVNANTTKVRTDLMEHEVYVEGYGGTVSCIEVSSKTGAGIDSLLEIILLLAEMENLTGNPEVSAEGYVVESRLDPKRGVSATLIIKNGTIHKGEYVVAGNGMATTRILENFMGEPIESATFSSPIRVVGFSTQCSAGSIFTTYKNKKDAEEMAKQSETEGYTTTLSSDLNIEETTIVPIILKCDVAGMIEAMAGEIEKLSGDGIFFKITKSGVGNINESDIQLASADPSTIIIGFNVKEDKALSKIQQQHEGAQVIELFTVIYKMTEWLEEIKKARRFRKEIEQINGVMKVIKVFSHSKKGHVVGCRVRSGVIKIGDRVHITRRDERIAYGKIIGLQIGKIDIEHVEDDMECGICIDTSVDVTEGDELTSFTIVEK